MRITGDQDVRIDFTDPDNQVKGLDLDGDGVIEQDGEENAIEGVASGFEIIDAYARNPLNHNDIENNFLGDIQYDGTGWDGDGVSTDGNVFLGGLGADTALGGIGNDFLAGGGVADPSRPFDVNENGTIERGETTTVQDELYGGRNADFFFSSLSLLDPTDGDNLTVHGGSTTDDSVVGNNTPQDSDWMLIEAADDEEPVTVDLSTEGFQSISTATGIGVAMDEIEHVDASGNLYGFLNDMNTTIGEGAGETHTAGEENSAYGATAQLDITGSVADNILIGGFDNDQIRGHAGDDLLMGGNLGYLMENQNNPNVLDIPNDGVDEITGGTGNDNLVFELDGGIYEGGVGADLDRDDNGNQGRSVDDSGKDLDQVVLDNDYDTLWLTENLAGASTVEEMTVENDNTVRLDLAAGKAGGLDNAAGYGGADEYHFDAQGNRSFTADQTHYKNEDDRSQVQDFENVNATGLGGIDYQAAGTNDPDLTFDNQQNFDGLTGADLDLRGTYRTYELNQGEIWTLVEDGNNHLYAGDGNDNLEGRTGDDKLMGGDGNDDFIFDLGYVDDLVDGDGENVIHRLDDTDGDGIWDGTYSQDFGIGGSEDPNKTYLYIDLTETDIAADNKQMDEVSIDLGGEIFEITDPANQTDLEAATNADEVAAVISNIFADEADVTVSVDGNVITLEDAQGRSFNDFDVKATVTEPGETVTNPVVDTELIEGDVAEDRLIFAAYEDRADGELVDDDAFVDETGDAVTLGNDAYAEDLVVRFTDDDKPSTLLAEGQSYDIDFENLADEDEVTITINGVQFSAQMGVSPSGSNIVEDMGEFLNRFASEINAAMDDDTKAGEVNVASDGTDTLTFTQVAYNGGETVFMDTPKVEIGNGSGGEPADYQIWNNTDTEVNLLEFDGRNGLLDAGTVLFLGGAGMNEGEVTDESMSRSVLATAENAGGDLEGKDAIVVDSIADADEKAVDYSLHGDDYLIGGTGADNIYGYTGDDRFQGSAGDDTIDGGKDHYVVTYTEGGVEVEEVLALNGYEADDKDIIVDQLQEQADISVEASQVVGAEYLDEDGYGLDNGDGYLDTLVFNENDFSGTSFTVVLDGDLEQPEGGKGSVTVDENDDGTAEHTTDFTEMEAIRTLSGDGTHAGQGTDTLDASAVSDAALATTSSGTAAHEMAGIEYYMDNSGNAGDVDVWLENDDPVDETDIEEIPEFIQVDGPENLIGGAGEDRLYVDETEARKDNDFDGAGNVEWDGTGYNPGDEIIYGHWDMDGDGSADDGQGGASGVDANNDGVVDENDFDDFDAILMRPSVTVALEVPDDGNTVDTVTMSGGTVLKEDSVDTLTDVEEISLNEAAQSALLDDTLDVSNISGVTVDFANEQIRDGDTIEASIYGMTDLEQTEASDGDDSVLIADDMNNYRAFATQTDNNNFTFFNADSLTSMEISNQGLYHFDLGEGSDDVMDYRNEVSDDIAAVVNPDGKINRVIVTDDLDAADYDEVDARVDIIENAELFYAGKDDFATTDSAIDISQINEDVTVEFSRDVTNEDQRAIVLSVGGNSFNESFVDDGLTDAEFAAGLAFADAAANGGNDNGVLDPTEETAFKNAVDDFDAYWNRIEGSDNDEKIILTDRESGHNITMNLRGTDHSDPAQNKVNYEATSVGTTLQLNEVLEGEQQQVEVDTQTSENLTGTDTITGDNNSLFIFGSNTGDDFISLEDINDEVQYSITMNIPFESGFKGEVVLEETDGNGDGAIDDPTSDSLESTTTITGYENIIGNNADNTYTVSASVNEVYAGSGDDSFVLTDIEEVEGDTWVADPSDQDSTGDGEIDWRDTKDDLINDNLRVGDMNVGEDTLDINIVGPSGSAFELDLNNGTQDQFVSGPASNGSLYGFENIDASDVSEGSITFDMTGHITEASTLSGGAGDDTLRGQSADTVLIGGDGADTLVFGGRTLSFNFEGTSDGTTDDGTVTIAGETFTEADAGGGAITGTAWATYLANQDAAFEAALGVDATDLDVTDGGGGVLNFEFADSYLATLAASDLSAELTSGTDAADTLTVNGTAEDGGDVDSNLVAESLNARYEDGGSTAADPDTLDNFTSGTNEIELAIDMGTIAGDSLSTAYDEGAAANASYVAGVVSSYYETDTNNLVVDFNANGTLQSTGDLTIDGIDSAAEIAEGDVVFDIVGTDANETITAGGGDDFIRGGAGDDVLDGGQIDAVGETLTFQFNAGSFASGTADGQLEVAELEFNENGNVYVEDGADTSTGALVATGIAGLADGMDSDAVGTAVESIDVATWTANSGDFAAGDLASVEYDPGSNLLSFNFTPEAGDKAAADLTAQLFSGGDGQEDIQVQATAEDAGTAISTDTGSYAAQVDSADTFIFEATAAENGNDTITNFNTGAGGDILDVSAMFDPDAVNNFDTAGGNIDADTAFAVLALVGDEGADLDADTAIGELSAYDANISADQSFLFAIDDGTDSGVYYFSDSNGDGTADLGEAEQLVTLIGVNDIDALNSANVDLG